MTGSEDKTFLRPSDTQTRMQIKFLVVKSHQY